MSPYDLFMAGKFPIIAVALIAKRLFPAYRKTAGEQAESREQCSAISHPIDMTEEAC